MSKTSVEKGALMAEDQWILRGSTENLLEQYKAYVGDLAGIGSRYATTQAFYISIVSILIAALAIKGPANTLTQYLSWLSCFVFLFIAAACALWQRTLQFYEGLFAVKFQILKRLEQDAKLWNLYAQEDLLLQNRPVPRLIGTERILPIGLLIVSLALSVASLVYNLI
jgi:hypothetical protein